jgi:hypothetical protein
MMRWTRGRFTAALTLALLGCGKSAARKAAEVRECSAITMDAKGAAQCLVLQHKWKQTEALQAATAYQRQQDSVKQARADSAWRADAGRHTKETTACAKDPSGEVGRCLVGYGWAEARAAGASDSLWRHDAAKHKQELTACVRQRKMQPGACLQLYYKWSPEHALAVDDSIRRARMRR